MIIKKNKYNLNSIFLKLILIISIPAFVYGNKSNLDGYHFLNAFAKEDLLVFKNEKDYEEWKKRTSDTDFIVKLYKQNKICTIPKDSYITLFRVPNDFRSFYISIFEKEEVCKGIVHEGYIHDKVRDMLKIEKENKAKNWENYYNSLTVFEISKDLSDLFSKKVPIKLDEVTTIVSVYSEKEKVYFNKELVLENKYIQQIKAIQDFVSQDDKKSICNNLVGNIFLNKRGIGVYNWDFYNNGKKIHSFAHNVKYEDCNK